MSLFVLERVSSALFWSERQALTVIGVHLSHPIVTAAPVAVAACGATFTIVAVNDGDGSNNSQEDSTSRLYAWGTELCGELLLATTAAAAAAAAGEVDGTRDGGGEQQQEQPPFARFHQDEARQVCVTVCIIVIILHAHTHAHVYTFTRSHSSRTDPPAPTPDRLPRPQPSLRPSPRLSRSRKRTGPVGVGTKYAGAAAWSGWLRRRRLPGV